jgi:hypothetical protein
MDSTDYLQPTDHQPLAPDYGPPPAFQAWPAYHPPAAQKRSRLKSALGGFALAGLLIVGGAATVFAASPSPSPSTSPSVTTPGTNGGTTTPGTHTPGNCPNMQTQTTTTSTSTGSSG